MSIPLVKSSVDLERRLYVSRAELVLARADHRPLACLGPDPDPLQRLAAAMAAVRSEDGEQADVVVDLVPVAARQVDRRRRALMGRAVRQGPSAFGERISGQGSAVWDTVRSALIEGAGLGRPASWQQQSRMPRQVDLSEGVGKFVPGEPVFEIQVLLRVVATHPARARALMHQLLAAMEVYSGENRWRPVGPRWGTWRAYSNAWWRRRGFDRRFSTGEFAPTRRQWVTPAEIAGLLKPPTAQCAAVNVSRTGGVVPPAPAALPEWTGQRGVVPLGRASGAGGRSFLAGVPVVDVLFGVGLGKSGFGKTEQALLQMIALAYGLFGTWFLDPHGAALERARPYLTHPAVRDRVQAINLRTPGLDDRFACWNPFDMSGRQVNDVQEVVGAIVGGIATAQGWGDAAPRARAILSNAVLVLALLAQQLVGAGQREIQPTVFQIKTLLTDPAWRAEVLELMPERVRRFWRVTFPQYEASAVPTITNALDVLETSTSLRAFLGGSISGYDVRRAMDTGAVVIVAPSGTGAGDGLITSLLIFDLFRATMSRQDTPREQRRTFFAWMDELAALDSAGRGFIAAIFEQARKYEVRLMVATQMAMRLSDTTRQAAMQNQSVLSATGADIDEARFVAARMNTISPETVAQLGKYQYVATAELRGQRTAPFRVAGVPIDEVYADYYDPKGLPGLDAAIDRTLRRRPVRAILAHMETLDERISDYLATHTPQPVESPATQATASRGASPDSFADTLVLPGPNTEPWES